MWDIMRCFAKKNQVNMNKIKEDSPAAKILGNTIEFEVPPCMQARIHARARMCMRKHAQA